ncbi:Arm DNA-binding domain-containing protein [Streptomyces spiralis]|uniref:Arm DNA-binding domain-containing protein n=1 Tax=Streptomyces spiralis TaxID=66376 RepID=UPI0036AD3F74
MPAAPFAEAQWLLRSCAVSTPSRRVSILSDPIKKLPPNSKGKVRYRFVVDAGIDPETGKRKQLRRTFDSLKEASLDLA